MNQRRRILDAEAHVVEPVWLWPKYLAPEFRERGPHVRPGQPGAGEVKLDLETRARIHLACQRSGADPDAVIEGLERPFFSLRDLDLDGRPLLDEVGLKAWPQGPEENWRQYLMAGLADFAAASHLEDFRRHGIEQAFLYPSHGLALFSLNGLAPDLARAMVRAYNDWLRDFCAQDPSCLRGVGAICRNDPAAMVQEVDRVASWGWRAVTLRPVPVDGRLLSDPAYEPFWARCEALGIAVGFHEAAHTLTPAGAEERFRSNFAMHSCSHPLEQMLGLLALIDGGVLERHPGLRVGFLESGCGWVPYWLWRMDTSYADNVQEMRERLPMKPSDYFRRQCFVTCEADEPGIELVIGTAGEGCVLFGSDYPHLDHPPRAQRDAGLLAERLSPAVAGRILWDNGCRFYGLPA